jgi:hypothetical protein
MVKVALALEGCTPLEKLVLVALADNCHGDSDLASPGLADSKVKKTGELQPGMLRRTGMGRTKLFTVMRGLWASDRPGGPLLQQVERGQKHRNAEYRLILQRPHSVNTEATAQGPDGVNAEGFSAFTNDSLSVRETPLSVHPGVDASQQYLSANNSQPVAEVRSRAAQAGARWSEQQISKALTTISEQYVIDDVTAAEALSLLAEDRPDIKAPAAMLGHLGTELTQYVDRARVLLVNRRKSTAERERLLELLDHAGPRGETAKARAVSMFANTRSHDDLVVLKAAVDELREGVA